MTNETNLTKEQVLEWLTARAEVLQDESFVARLPLSDNRQGAASLLDRQNQMLRNANEALTQQLSELISVAQENERLFNHTRQLVLALISATNVQELANTLQQQLQQHFNANAVQLLLYAPENSLAEGAYRCVEPGNLNADIQAMLAKSPITCGTFRPHEMAELFGTDSIGSAALIQLSHARTLGVLAIGSADPLHFHNALDTLFVEHIGAALSRRLEQLLPSCATPTPAQQAAQ